jgi:hypothetical protein
MDDDDLPPPPRRHDQPAFSRALGFTVGQFAWIAIFIAIVGVILYGVVHWH